MGAATPSASAERIHSLDGLRASLMLLGIPYHAALAFCLESWLVSAERMSVSLEAFAEFLHVWRMPAFFVVAGVFASIMLRRRGPAAWLRGRLQRLGIPLVAAMLVLSPLQWLVVGMHRTGEWSAAWAFVLDRAWPVNNWWTIHLWFLVELLVYCAVLAAVAATPLGARVARRLAGPARLRRPLVAFTLALAVAAVAVWAGLALWDASHAFEALGGLVSRHLVLYAPAFALGCVVGSSFDRLRAFRSLPVWPVAGLFVVATGAVIVARIAWSAELSVVLAVGGLAGAALAFRVAGRVFAAPSAVVRWLVDASLPVYLVHQPFVVLFAALWVAAGVDGWAGWLLTTAPTLLASLLVYEVLNRWSVSRLLSTGTRRRGASVLELLPRRPDAPVTDRGTIPRPHPVADSAAGPAASRS